ncbi:MAG: hypothetical protein KC487_01010, partial [Anaerolineae bacterium]|nr:hypothetical protein [Anaerolineae bacterium]
MEQPLSASLHAVTDCAELDIIISQHDDNSCRVAMRSSLDDNLAVEVKAHSSGSCYPASSCT